MEKEKMSEVAVKNSAYTFMSSIIFLLSGLIFTVILARVLLPELFGIYSLALSLALIALTFTDLGIDSASIRYVSSELGRGSKKRARSYFRYLFKIKGGLILLVLMIFLMVSKYLAYDVYNKPLLYLPLVFSCLFILMESTRSFFMTLFVAKKKLRATPFLGTALQISKILLSIIAIIILSPSLKIPGIFVAFAISGLFYLILSYFIFFKIDKKLIFGKKTEIEKPRVLKYIKFAALSSLSLVFFASIDTLMLGRFVEASYIGYYRVAISLVFAISALLSTPGILLPVFTQINKKRFRRGFQKIFRYIVMFAIPLTFGLIVLAPYIILTLYGEAYIQATIPIYILSLLIITFPLIEFYSTLFKAKEKVKDLSKIYIISLILNIILNYILIKSFLSFGELYAIMGASIATVISRAFLLGFLVIKAKTYFKLIQNKKSLLKQILAGLIMALFLFSFNYFLNINLFLGILEIILGALIYFGVLLLTKEFIVEDITVLNYLIKGFLLKKK